MPFDIGSVALRDIPHHIELVRRFVEGLDFATFQGDLRTVYAVTRCLEIISEASRRIPDEVRSRHPSIAWKDMAAAGNIYRHEYEDVDAKQLWDTVRLALPPLQVVIAQELAGLG